MQDIKNLTIASVCTAFPFIEAITSRTTLSIISAIVLPVTFFVIGKAIDAAVQIYLYKAMGKEKQK